MINIDNMQYEIDNLTRIHANKYCYMQGDIRLEIFENGLILDRGINEFGNIVQAIDLIDLGLYEKIITALKNNKKFDLVEE